MKQLLLRALKFDAAILPLILIAGVSVGFYEWTTGIAAAVEGITKVQFVILVLAQTLIYAMVTGFLGYLLADRIGLLRSFAFRKKPLMTTIAWGILGGIGFFLLEAVIFSALIP